MKCNAVDVIDSIEGSTKKMEKATAQNAVESRDVVEACTNKIIDAMEKNTRKSSRSN